MYVFVPLGPGCGPHLFSINISVFLSSIVSAFSGRPSLYEPNGLEQLNLNRKINKVKRTERPVGR